MVQGKRILLAAFDMDGTLAERGEPPLPGTVAGVKRLQSMGVRVALVSGKPAWYLTGVARGAGLGDVPVIGEQGCVVHRQDTRETLYLAERTESMERIRGEIARAFSPNVWFQPNEINVTAFPRGSVRAGDIRHLVERLVAEREIDDVRVLAHVDAVDVMPRGVDKGVGLGRLCEMLGIYNLSRVAAVGDAPDDIPMLESAGFSVAVGADEAVRAAADVAADDIAAALRVLIEKAAG